jgi:hypothetical protein
MAKKARKKVAAKAKKPAKGAAKRKAAVAKSRRKPTTAKKAKPAVSKTKPVSKKAKPVAVKAKPVARNAKPAVPAPIVAPQAAPPPRQSFVKKVEQKIEGAVAAVIDTLTDAERLHHKLDPGVPPIPE